MSPNIKYLSIQNNNFNIIDNLPNSIVELHLVIPFNSPLHNLPTGLKKLVFEYYDGDNSDSDTDTDTNSEYSRDDYVHELNLLPNSLEHLVFPPVYKKQILNFPKNLRTIECSEYYAHKAELENIFAYKIIYF